MLITTPNSLDRNRTTLKPFLLLLAISLFSHVANGQTAQFTQGSSAGSSAKIQVPLGSFPGRGINLPINLNYSSDVWRIGFIKSVTIGSSVWQGTAEAIYAEYSTAGWTTSLDVPKVEWPQLNDVYWYDGKPYPRGSIPGFTYRVANVFIHMPDGSVHELRRSDAVYASGSDINKVGNFYSVDGSRMRYDTTVQFPTLYLPDGSRYVWKTGITEFSDRNGNTLVYDNSSRQWKDTMNRNVGMPWPTNPQPNTPYYYTVPGFGLNGTTTYTIVFKNLSSLISSSSLKPIGDYYLPNPAQAPSDINGGNFPQPTQTASHFFSGYSDKVNDPPAESSYTYVIGRGQTGSNNFDPVVLAEVDLPNGQKYQFSYNSLGELEKVTYPSGAYQRYAYGSIPGYGLTEIPYGQGTRGVGLRALSPNGAGNDEQLWTYSYSANTTKYTQTLTAPDGVRTETDSYNLYDPQNNNTFGYLDGRNGVPYEERIYAPASQGGALLRRTLTDWTTSNTTNTRPSPGSGSYVAMRNPKATKTVTVFLDTDGDALSASSTFSYDMSTQSNYEFTVGLECTGTSEYGFKNVLQSTAGSGAIGLMPLGNLVKSTSTSYLTSNSNYRNRNILGFPTTTSISDANGLVSQNIITYDDYASRSLMSFGPVIGWSDPQTDFRGNPTSSSVRLDYPSVTWIQTQTQFDQYGNARKFWDGMGRVDPQKVIEFSADSFYAYPTKTTSIAPDPSGTYGQTIGFESSSVFDFNTGLVTSTTNINGQRTDYEYDVPLNRLKKITRPDGSWTTHEYHEDAGNNYVVTRTLQHSVPSQQVLESYQYFDRLGRIVRSFANEGTTYVATDTQYDSLGRVFRVSNPYRTNAPSMSDDINPPNLWSVTAYDPKYPNRVRAVTTADGAHSNTAYAYNLTTPYTGLTVTVTDPAGKSRMTVSDAFGRMIQVVEAPNGAAYQTNYTYDALNNLRKVEQGSQIRFFGYDSLSRLIRIRQVEQTINNSLPQWTDPITGHSGWTSAITYDNNGNKATLTDARNITTTFTYDQLDRVTTVRYGNDTSNTPGINSYYDGYRDGSYTNVAKLRGTLWQSETINQVKFTTDDVDVMERPTVRRQQFWNGTAWSGSYTVTASYDLAGTLTSETYPSGHTIYYDIDPAGRLKSVSGNLGDGLNRIYSNNFQYNEAGVLQQEQFGTQIPLYHKQRFNLRGQLWGVLLSTASFSTDPANGDRGSILNYYSNNFSPGGSGPDNNGNLLRQEIYVPGGPFFQQTYSYDDPLNRLTSVSEKLNGIGGESFKQTYTYDRWGNRSISPSETTNVPKPAYTVDANNTNQLIAPSGFSYGYDAAGNQTNDTYSGAGERKFDAENHMISAQSTSGLQSYKYSGSGLRVRRILNGSEVWQVYGIGGSLLSDYQAGAASFLPIEEFAYRGGQMLTSVSSGDAKRLTRFIYNLYYGALQRDPTSQELTDATNDLTLAGQQGQAALLSKAAEIARTLFVSTNYETSISHHRTDTQYVTDLYYAYLHRAPDTSGLTWWSTTNNGSDGALIRVNVLNAFEASGEFQSLIGTLFGTVNSDNERTEHFVNNFYLAVSGTNASPSQLQQQRDRLNNAAAVSYATVQGEAEAIGRELLGPQVTDLNVSETQFVTNLYEAFLQRGPDVLGLSFWVGQAGTNNPAARQNVLNQFATCGPFRDLAGTLYREVFWVVSDQLGSPRIVVDKSGTLSSVKRHDYLPFGEEIGSIQSIGGNLVSVGSRQGIAGYVTDSLRQKFTGYESDSETGLNYAQARYQSNVQGRFTSVDPLAISAIIINPQTFNRYSYVNNAPTNLTDPSGMAPNIGYRYREADLSWEDVSSSFWGRPDISTMGRRNIGWAHVAQGMYRNSVLARMVRTEPDSCDVTVSAQVTGPANGAWAAPSVTDTPQIPLGTVLIVYGEPGEVQNAGDVFERAALTKKNYFESIGYKVLVVAVHSAADFKDAFNNNGKLDAFEYVGHASWNWIGAGSAHTESANFQISDIKDLSKNVLNPEAYVKLNACYAGSGAWQSIAGQLSNHLDRWVWAMTGGTVFSSSESHLVPITRGSPAYVIEDVGTNLIGFRPFR
ncbi:MAG TPA: DUF4214 domain-containing protein [Pyrinomonadaceae bacterium]